MLASDLQNEKKWIPSSDRYFQVHSGAQSQSVSFLWWHRVNSARNGEISADYPFATKEIDLDGADSGYWGY